MPWDHAASRSEYVHTIRVACFMRSAEDSSIYAGLGFRSRWDCIMHGVETEDAINMQSHLWANIICSLWALPAEETQPMSLGLHK